MKLFYNTFVAGVAIFGGVFLYEKYPQTQHNCAEPFYYVCNANIVIPERLKEVNSECAAAAVQKYLATVQQLKETICYGEQAAMDTYYDQLAKCPPLDIACKNQAKCDANEAMHAWSTEWLLGVGDAVSTLGGELFKCELQK
jgi:hypothetical protein